MKLIRLLVVALVLCAAGFYGQHWWRVGRFIQSTDNAYLRADISALTSRVAGEVVAVHVHNNQPVKAGDLLIEIDPRDYQARLAQAQAQVAQAQAALASNRQQQHMQTAMIEEAGASLDAAQAERARAGKDLQRAESLVRDGVATQARLDSATAANQSASAMRARGEAGLKVSREQQNTLAADSHRLDALLHSAQAQLQLAQLDLEATSIRAPVGASIGDLAVKLGERVGPGLRLLSLVALENIWIEANYKETQLTHMNVGQLADVTVDAFPDQKFSGRIDSLAPASGTEFSLLPPNNATGNFTKIVQRIPVKILLDEVPLQWRGRLRPGLSAEVRVNTRVEP